VDLEDPFEGGRGRGEAFHLVEESGVLEMAHHLAQAVGVFDLAQEFIMVEVEFAIDQPRFLAPGRGGRMAGPQGQQRQKRQPPWAP
jgi:hypothetical protein